MRAIRLLIVLISLISLLTSYLPTAAQTESLPETAYVSGVNGHAQFYSLSCEARSAVDWAAFWGVAISESEFLSSLLRSDNPNIGFVGQPNDPWGYTPPYGYGVHAGPAAALLRHYGLQAEARLGLQWDELRAEIAAGRPVIVWIIGQMWRGYPRSYTASDGEVVTVASFEHTMILIGYDASRVTVVDAYSGQTQVYPLQAFLTSWSALGNMAITGKRAEEVPPVSPVEATTYTVRPGDYLVALAARFGTTWQTLVALNDIAYPYTIYPGQVLQLPTSVEAPATPSPAPASTPTTNPPQEETYVVQRGEYLALIANKTSVDWRTLAALNGIYYPYIIFTGQVLRLR